MVRVEKQNSFARNSTFRAQDLGFLALGFGFRALFVLVLCLGFWVWCLGFFGVFVMAVTCDSCCFGRNKTLTWGKSAPTVSDAFIQWRRQNRGWLAMLFEKKQTRYTLYTLSGCCFDSKAPQTCGKSSCPQVECGGMLRLFSLFRVSVSAPCCGKHMDRQENNGTLCR